MNVALTRFDFECEVHYMSVILLLNQLPFAPFSLLSQFFLIFNFYFFSTNCGPGTVLVIGNKMMNKVVITSTIMQLTI